MKKKKLRHKSLKTRSPKQKLLSAIRHAKGAATLLRLRGLVNSAMRYEEDIDRMVRTAESKGWANEASLAEDWGLKNGKDAYHQGKWKL
jgi:hypothetical protein